MPNGNGRSLPSAVGTSLAQLLRRPEILIEDFAPVVAESYPEYFADIDRTGALIANEAVTKTYRVPPTYSRADDDSLNGRRADGDSRKSLSAAARTEMKTVETEIKYAGYLD